MLRLRLLIGLAPLALAACSLGGSGTPTVSLRATPGNGSPAPSATPQIVGTTRTVLTQLGLNMHAAPSTGAALVGVLGQGAQVSVLQYQAANGGWFKVQGATVSGWIVADPTLTATGTFTSYTSDQRGFSAFYPDSWTFAEEPNDVLFRPQQAGSQTIVVTTAPSLAALGSGQPSGSVATFSQQEIVCGYTGELVEYQRQPGAAAGSPSPAGTSAVPLSGYAQIQLRFDASHAMQLAFNYDSKNELDVFSDFYNSISFPYPLCQAPVPATPSPT